MKSLINRLCWLPVLLWLVGCSPVPVVEQAGTEPDSGSGKLDAKFVRQYDKAIRLLKEGRYDKAEPAFLELAKRRPTSSGPQANLGIVYAETGRLEEAEQALRHAIELNPGNPEVYNRLGVLLRKKGEFSQSLVAYNRALSLQPENRNAHYNMGILYDLYLNQPRQALDHYETYLTLVGGDDTVRLWVVDLKQRLEGTL